MREYMQLLTELDAAQDAAHQGRDLSQFDERMKAYNASLKVIAQRWAAEATIAKIREMLCMLAVDIIGEFVKATEAGERELAVALGTCSRRLLLLAYSPDGFRWSELKEFLIT